MRRICCVALLVVPIACVSGPTVVSVDPPIVEPGELVRVTTDRPAFDSQDVRVRVGGEPAPVVRSISSTEAEVLAPLAAAGKTTITVQLGTKAAGRAAELSMLPAPSQQLVLDYRAGKLALVASHPRAGDVSEDHDRGGPLLSFDVLDAAGGVVYSGVTTHPTRGRIEVYDLSPSGAPTVHLAAPRSDAQFSIKIPRASTATLVRFFDVPDDVDVATVEGRARRVPIGEVQLRR